MRSLAVDLGARRVGLALSDEGGRFATPYEVLEVRSPADAIEQVMNVIGREGVQRIVLGLPLNMDGSAGGAATQVHSWGEQLGQRSGLPVLYVDERLSSFEAEQQLAARRRAGEKLTHQRKKEQRDALAAASFLQAFLDGKLQAE